MSYMALYRKWRPDAFEEVKGQEHIVKTLKNQLTHERVGHAYLFCGTRGTGKTTVAKLFAKAVNCEHPLEDGSPCNECATCKAISEGSSMNVMEIDAASNNGVDSIREIKDEVQYSPTSGKYKVYIIDEVHMLSTGAFNALLKTLEEPPSYVIFILATTESHKIPVTISSRCQRYDFRRISLETIKNRLMDLMEREAIDVEEEAIAYVAKAADGSMRDALSLLEQCIAFYLGEKLTYEKVLDVLGAVDYDIFHKILNAVIESRTVEAVDLIDEIIWQGREVTQFVTDFTWYLRNLLLVKSDPQGAQRLDLSHSAIEGLMKMAETVSDEALIRYIAIFSGMTNEMRYTNQKRVILEVNIIKMCKPQMETSYESILERVRVLEKELNEVKKRPVQTVVQTSVVSNSPREDDRPQIENPEEYLKQKLEPADYEKLKKIISEWPQIVRTVSGPQSYIFQNESMTLEVSEDGKSLMMVFDCSNKTGDLAYEYMQQEEHYEDVKNLIANTTGVDIHLVCVKRGSAKAQTSLGGINLSNMNFPVEQE